MTGAGEMRAVPALRGHPGAPARAVTLIDRHGYGTRGAVRITAPKCYR